MSHSCSGHDRKKEEGLLFLILAGRLMKRRKKWRIWVHETLQKQSDLGEYYKVVIPVWKLDSHEDRFYGYMYFQRSCGQFAEILTLVNRGSQRLRPTGESPSLQLEDVRCVCDFVFVLANGFKLRNLCTFWRHSIKLSASKFHDETKDVGTWRA